MNLKMMISNDKSGRDSLGDSPPRLFGRALPIWRAVVRLPKPSEEATAFASKNPVDFSHGSMSITND